MKAFTLSSAIVLFGSLQGLLAGTTPVSKTFDVVKRAGSSPLKYTSVFGEPHGDEVSGNHFGLSIWTNPMLV